MGLLDFFQTKNKTKKVTNISHAKQAEANASWVSAMYLIAEKKYEQAEKELLNGLRKSKNIIDNHFIYNQLIKLYYLQRETEGYLNKCIKICLKDIEMFEEFRNAYIEDEFNPKGTMPRIPSFQQLAIIYEKQGRYAKAIDICKKALSYGLKDKTKGGFEERIKRLEKKRMTSK